MPGGGMSCRTLLLGVAGIAAYLIYRLASAKE
jgi:hypothetical protein